MLVTSVLSGYAPSVTSNDFLSPVRKLLCNPVQYVFWRDDRHKLPALGFRINLHVFNTSVFFVKSRRSVLLHFLSLPCVSWSLFQRSGISTYQVFPCLLSPSPSGWDIISHFGIPDFRIIGIPFSHIRESGPIGIPFAGNFSVSPFYD